MVLGLRGENRDLLGGLHVAEAELHREAVHLRLGQRIGAAELHRVLGGDHEEQLGQLAAHAVHRDLALPHRLQQRRLGARRGAVDLVGQEDVGEDRPLVEAEALGAGVVDRHTDDVRRQQIGRELHALEGGADRAGERLGQRGLAGAGVVLEQHVTAAGECGQQPADRQLLAAHDHPEICRDPPEGVARRVTHRSSLVELVGGALLLLAAQPLHQALRRGGLDDLVELRPIVGDEAHTLDRHVVDQPAVAGTL